MALDAETTAAAQKYGHLVDGIAAQHGLSGADLLGKLVMGESGGNANQVSSAGARGLAQFMPGTRQIAIQKFGIDPWRSPDEAVHAAALHLRGDLTGSRGLAGYNPGDPSYPNYILGQQATAGKSPAATGAINLGQLGKGAAAGGKGSTMRDQIINNLLKPVLGPFATAGMGPQDWEPLQKSPKVPGQTTPDTMGVPGAAVQAQATGGYAGTQGLVQGTAIRIAKAVGVPVTSEKRNIKYAASGLVSDHYIGNKTAYAADLGASGDKAQMLANQIAHAYGVRFIKDSYQSGGYIQANGQTYRIQILFGAGVNHADHVHVGIALQK